MPDTSQIGKDGFFGEPTNIIRSRIVTIVNSAIAQSATDAATYQSARGLSADLTLSFNFPNVQSVTWEGLDDPSYMSAQGGEFHGLSFIAALTELYTSRPIDGVIASTWTPANVKTPYNGGEFYFPPLAAAAGLATPSYGETAPVQINGTPYRLSIPDDYSSFNFVNVHAWRGQKANRAIVPFGRLGCPDFTQSTIAEATLNPAFGSGSVFANALANALAVETAQYDPIVAEETIKSQPHWGSNADSYGPTLYPVAANQLALTFMQDSPGFINARTLPANFFSGTASPAINIFAYCVGSSLDNTGANEYANSIADIQNGAWGSNWQSDSNVWAQWWLENNASLFFASAGEPLAANSPIIASILYLLITRKCSAMEANFFSGSTFGATESTACWPLGMVPYGDPLYSPYSNTIYPFSYP